MTRLRTSRLAASLVAVACVGGVAAAVFSGKATVLNAEWCKGVDDLSLTSLWQQGASPAQASKAAGGYLCPRCGVDIGWGSNVCLRCGRRWPRSMNQVAMPVCPPTGTLAAATQVPAATQQPATKKPATKKPAASATRAMSPSSALPSPRQQGAAGKEMIEGHWVGLEVITLVPVLAKTYGIPDGETGVLVDEITLEAAESGILAGDLVQSIENHPTSDLKAFFLATQHVKEKERANVNVSRRGDKMTFVFEARNAKTLGFAQMEAAQPIMPGALSPHRSRGKACTHCHIIMRTGGQLPTDAGDILPTPPPITSSAVAPHGNRGKCNTCHVIK